MIVNALWTLQKGTKNALETGRTFATLFADMDLRLRLLVARTENEFKKLMWEHMNGKKHTVKNNRRAKDKKKVVKNVRANNTE